MPVCMQVELKSIPDADVIYVNDVNASMFNNIPWML